MSKDIQFGKDQIENYQNGDVDRPYKHMSKEYVRCRKCDSAITTHQLIKEITLINITAYYVCPVCGLHTSSKIFIGDENE